MSKILITGGCSFSMVARQHGVKTWPAHLFSKLQELDFVEHLSSAMSSQGNGLISRGVQYHVIKALEKYKPEDILVGVMWSHSNRLDYRCQDSSLLSWGTYIKKNGWLENPRAFVDNAPKNWVIIGNHHWDNVEFSTYYKFYYSHIGASILSLEHILRTQYFLKSKGIRYFFTDFVDENIVRKEDQDSDELTYLLKELDRSQYLPVSSMAGWIVDCAEDKGYLNPNIDLEKQHPTLEQHKEFLNRVIYPWLTDKGYV